MAKRNRARAVFHDRVAMEEAVRALELEGVSARRIHVSRADASGGHVRTPAEGGRAAGVGAGFGAVVGGALALLSIAAADVPSPFFAVVARILAGVAIGALAGGLVGLVVDRFRHQSRYAHPTAYKDFLVRVDAEDAAAADDVRDLLDRAGGDLLPA